MRSVWDDVQPKYIECVTLLLQCKTQFGTLLPSENRLKTLSNVGICPKEKLVGSEVFRFKLMKIAQRLRSNRDSNRYDHMSTVPLHGDSYKIHHIGFQLTEKKKKKHMIYLISRVYLFLKKKQSKIARSKGSCVRRNEY